MDMNQYSSLALLLLYFAFVGGDIIGDRCRYDSDCFIEQSYCHRQEVCECKENFLPTEDLLNCVATIGAICNSKHDCNSLLNSQCIEENCLCERGYVPDPHNIACKPVSSGLKGDCEFDTQCQTIMGDFATCNHGRCECLPHHHYHGKCVKSRALGDSCRNSSECYSTDHYRNVTECIGGRCNCKPGYIQTYDGHCRNSGILNTMEQILIIFTGVLTVYRNKYLHNAVVF